MRGSEKQISWAKEIKSEKHINALCDALIKRAGLNEAGLAKVEEFRAFLLSNEDAKFWIDNRVYLNCHSENYIDLDFHNAMSFFKEWFTANK